MGFREAVERVLRQYATFRGRAPRAEYWWFYLFSVLVGIVASVLDGVLGTNLLSPVASLALLLPSLAVGVRRLHDSNLSGWWLLAPAVCGIIALALMLAGVGAVRVDTANGDRHVTGVAVVLFLLGLVMALVSAVLGLVLMLRRSTPGPNRFGPHPYAETPSGQPPYGRGGYDQGGNPPYGGQPGPYQGYGTPQSGPYGNQHGNPYGGSSPDYGDQSGPR